MVVCMGSPLGDRIKMLRKDRDWTQGQLATYAGVKRSWLSNVESGEIDNPRAEYLGKIATSLAVSVEYLTTGRSAGPDEIVISGPEEKAAPLRRMSRYPAHMLNRFERLIADMFDLHDEPTGDPASQRGQHQAQQDQPDAATDGPGKPR